MSNKEKVLAYYDKWANKATNPVNGVRVVQEGKTLESFGVVVVMDGLGCQFRHNPWHYNYDDVFWDRLVLLLRLDQPVAAVPSKEADYWESYAKQTRGELTKVQQGLADLKAAYNGLCEAHKELAEKLADYDLVSGSEVLRLGMEKIEAQDISELFKTHAKLHLQSAVKTGQFKRRYGRLPE